jgi:hypothetical protein
LAAPGPVVHHEFLTHLLGQLRRDYTPADVYGAAGYTRDDKAHRALGVGTEGAGCDQEKE